MNTTMFASPSARGRMRARSPSEDEETLVYARRPAAALPPSDRILFNEIVRQLAAPLARAQAIAPVVLQERPNVFEIPWAPGDPPLPWATSVPATKRSGIRARARRRIAVPSLIFFMSFGIAYGLVRDPAARASTVAQLRTTAHQARMLIVR